MAADKRLELLLKQSKCFVLPLHQSAILEPQAELESATCSLQVNYPTNCVIAAYVIL